jgi:hypothetical protein
VLQEEGVTFLVNGHGAKEGRHSPLQQTLFGKVQLGFVIHTVYNDMLMIQSVEASTGQISYEMKIPQRRKAGGDRANDHAAC